MTNPVPVIGSITAGAITVKLVPGRVGGATVAPGWRGAVCAR